MGGSGYYSEAYFDSCCEYGVNLWCAQLCFITDNYKQIKELHPGHSLIINSCFYIADLTVQQGHWNLCFTTFIHLSLLLRNENSTFYSISAEKWCETFEDF